MRVAWTLEEIGEPFELVRVTQEEAQGAEHRARHPLGSVPVLELDGQTLFDSTALVLHLADRHPEAGLIGPLGSPERALVYQWSLTALTALEGPAVQCLVSRRSGTDAADAQQRFAAGADAVTGALGDRQLLVGDRLTVADIVAGGVLSIADLAGVMADSAPGLVGYLERLRSRPAYRRAADATESLFAS